MQALANVLLVEDDDVDVEVISRLFKKHEIKIPVSRAANGIEALNMLRGQHSSQKVAEPFVILLDLNMPMMNGIEMLKELRQDLELKNSIVFVLTTSPREEDKQAAYQLNVAGYFLKKDTRELTSLLSSYCAINNFPDT